MKKKQLSLLILAVLFISPIVMQYNIKQAKAADETAITTSSEQASQISYQFINSHNDNITNTLGGTIKIKNASASDLNLSTVAIKYYYSADSETTQNFYCDYCGVTSGGYKNLTGIVKGNFSKTDDLDPTKSNLLEITFDSNAGSIKSGDELELQFRIAKGDWTNYTQNNDYVYNNGIEVYVGDSNVQEQEKTQPVVTPTSATFQKNAPTDINVNVNYNEHNLLDIKDNDKVLEVGQDYTISGNTVIINKSYLNSLLFGTTTLTFAFDNNIEKSISINVIEEVYENSLNINVEDIEAKAGDVVDIPIIVTMPDNIDTYGVGFNFNIDSAKYEYLGVAKGEELMNVASDMLIECSYVKDKNVVVSYSIFPIDNNVQASTIHGKYLFATYKIKLNDNLASGTKIPVVISDMGFSTKDGQAMEFTSSIGYITIE